MRNPAFIAVHRGGLLSRENHRQLIRWARLCTLHAIARCQWEADLRVISALATADEWEKGKVKTGQAMTASLLAHSAARELNDKIGIALARSAGQAVATAHMADHSVGAALYALKALKLASLSPDEEKRWQEDQLKIIPVQLKEQLLLLIKEKGRNFGLFP
jgi:hypothetical protein